MTSLLRCPVAVAARWQDLDRGAPSLIMREVQTIREVLSGNYPCVALRYMRFARCAVVLCSDPVFFRPPWGTRSTVVTSEDRMDEAMERMQLQLAKRLFTCPFFNQRIKVRGAGSCCCVAAGVGGVADSLHAASRAAGSVGPEGPRRPGVHAASVRTRLARAQLLARRADDVARHGEPCGVAGGAPGVSCCCGCVSPLP